MILLNGCNNELVSNGDFYTIEESYEYGWLNQEDIKVICYNKYGEVFTGEKDNVESWVKIDYSTSKNDYTVDSKTEEKIKQLYLSKNREYFYDDNDDIIFDINSVEIRCFLIKSDVYVVSIYNPFWNHGDVVYPHSVAGVAWFESEIGMFVYK